MNASKPNIGSACLENLPSSGVYCEKVCNVVITKSMFALTVFGLHKASIFENLPFRFTLRFWITALGSLITNMLHFHKNDAIYYSVFNVWGNGYHHWLTEVAPKIMRFENDIRAGTLLLPEIVPRFAEEFFAMFGIVNVKRLKGNNFFKRVSLISNPRSGHYDPDLMAVLRTRIFERLKVTPKPMKRLYITRRNARSRKVANEGDVIALLESFGFDCLDLENFSFVEQVRWFAECEFLMSIHGAGLTNSIFMPTNGAVVELFPLCVDREKELNACYKRLADALGLQHSFFWCDRIETHEKFALDTGDIKVNLSELETYLVATLH